MAEQPKTLTNEQILQKVANAEFGGDVEGMLEHCALGGVAPGVCTVCLMVHDSLEPDAEDYECNECETNTVQSVLVLAGVI